MKYDKLRKFLYDDYFESYVDKWPDFKEKSHKSYNLALSEYKKYYYPSLLLRKFTLSNPFFKREKIRFMLEHNVNHYDYLINGLDCDYVVLGAYSNSFFNLLKPKIHYIPIFDIYANLLKALMLNDEYETLRSLEQMKSVIKTINPEVIILYNDMFTIGRALCLVSRDLGIKTVEIQHGLYQKDSKIGSGKYVDYVFLWGTYFKEAYIKQNIKKKEQLKILGYPKKIKLVKKSWSNTVIYLGQNYEDLDFNHFETKIVTIVKLNSICSKLGLNFIYKPHPGDNLERLLKRVPNLKYLSKNLNLLDSFIIGDIFISFNSTSLVEAALHSKICIQFRNYDLKADDFSELGICSSFDDFSELESHLKTILKNKTSKEFLTPVNENYIEIPQPNPSRRFLDLINEI